MLSSGVTETRYLLQTYRQVSVCSPQICLQPAGHKDDNAPSRRVVGQNWSPTGDRETVASLSDITVGLKNYRTISAMCLWSSLAIMSMLRWTSPTPFSVVEHLQHSNTNTIHPYLLSTIRRNSNIIGQLEDDPTVQSGRGLSSPLATSVGTAEMVTVRGSCLSYDQG